MNCNNEVAEIFVPDGKSVQEALARTTHMGIGAHPDDLEIMAYHGILQCFRKGDQWFTGVVVTDGAGSPRSGRYKDCTDEEMRNIRKVEQRKASVIGEYGAQFMLGYSSAGVMDAENMAVVDDIKTILQACRPKVVYTHNLADKHDTHVAVVLRVIQAIRELPLNERPEAVYGCEVWRGLDWMLDADKVALDVSGNEELFESLIRVFESQVEGGKRYDLAAIGRMNANATYYASHSTDSSNRLIFAMDLTPLIKDTQIDEKEYAAEYIHRFAEDVTAKIEKLK